MHVYILCSLLLGLCISSSCVETSYKLCVLVICLLYILLNITSYFTACLSIMITSLFHYTEVLKIRFLKFSLQNKTNIDNKSSEWLFEIYICHLFCILHQWNWIWHVFMLPSQIMYFTDPLLCIEMKIMLAFTLSAKISISAWFVIGGRQ